MASGIVRLHRVLKAKPERVYKAFLDSEALSKWLPPFGFTCVVHQLRSEEHTSELQSQSNLVCRLLLLHPPKSTLFPYTTLFRSWAVLSRVGSRTTASTRTTWRAAS